MTTIPASQIRPGHSLPGLDNGYVVEVEEQDGYLSSPTSRYNTALPDNMICITFHDRDGNESYLIVSDETPLTVDSLTPNWVG